ncbi:hypothetical protein AX16_008296 [Volvariella volvacea WC 439]|nr:hypothetical protein AX16_008296 [Volvariella volvacea WC 439]
MVPQPDEVEMEDGFDEEDEGLMGEEEGREYMRSNLLFLQLRALLDASDEVDLPKEILDDLMQTLALKRQQTKPPQDPHAPQGANMGLQGEANEEEDPDDEEADRNFIAGIDPSLAYASLYAKVTDGEEKAKQEEAQLWSELQIKQMKHFLKEKGIADFVWQYVFSYEVSVEKLVRGFGVKLAPELLTRRKSTLIYILRVVLSYEIRQRDKLPQYNTIDDAVELIRKSKQILILTGAGISVSCGIPDFRSRNGLYATLKDSGNYDLDDPQQMFDINYFKENPAVFYSFARSVHLSPVEEPIFDYIKTVGSQIYPSNFIPSPCHRFIKAIETEGRNYTQNIDTLETLVGVKNVLQCHGSFATATCLICKRRVPGKDIEYAILNHKVPICGICNEDALRSSSNPRSRAGLGPGPGRVIIGGSEENNAASGSGNGNGNGNGGKKWREKKKTGKKKAKGKWDSDDEDESDEPDYPPWIMKPDITFFGEKLSDKFDISLAEDREKVDLILIIGTSLKVSPVADMLSHLPHSVPQILINKTPIRHINPDIVLLGDADGIILHIKNQLKWVLPTPFPVNTPEYLWLTGKQEPPPGRFSSTLSNTRSGKRKLDSSPKRLWNEEEEEEETHNLPKRVYDSHVWLFEGAEGGKWLEEFEHQWLLQHGGNNSDEQLNQISQSHGSSSVEKSSSQASSGFGSDSNSSTGRQENGKRKAKRARVG